MPRAPLVGKRIRKRRQELGEAQSTLAARLGISSSYLNLIEHNKRPIGGALLHRIAATIGLDNSALAGTEEYRLIAELYEVAADSAQLGVTLTEDSAREIVANNPEAARAILGLYRAYREVRARTDFLGERLGQDSFLAETSQQILSLITTIRAYAEILKDYGDLSDADRSRFSVTLVDETEALATHAAGMFDFMSGKDARPPRASPREEVEDFISDRANHFPDLEQAAERTLAVAPDDLSIGTLSDLLQRRHGVGVERRSAIELAPRGERLDGHTFLLSGSLERANARFRLARLFGSLEYGDRIDALVDGAALATPEARARLQRTLAGYYAAALIMPYAPFRATAEATRYDLGDLGRRFDVSFEAACHRLTTLNRPGVEGIPMHFLRTDIAGNISRRFSGSGLRLPRHGGACPRWIVHHAFTMPGRIVTQVGRLPEGETFLFVARADPLQGGTWVNEPCHAVMIGCSMAHAHRLAFADGLDFASPQAAVPIGITCRQCPREDCGQRAHDQVRMPGQAPAPPAVT